MDSENMYLSNVITNAELDSIQPGQFNVLAAPRGWGKTTFMFDDRILNFSRAKKHVLYLVQNKATRDSIVAAHPEDSVTFANGGDNGWLTHRKKSLWTLDEDENKIHVMCYQTFAALLRNEGSEWLDDIDLIIWDEFDDIKGYYEKEVKQLKRMLPNFSMEKLTSLVQEGRLNSVINFVYQIKTLILDPAKIKLIAISATPENAALYFRDYVNYIIKGKLEEKFDAQNTIFIESVSAAAREGLLKADGKHKYWCFTKYVSDAIRLRSVLTTVGFNVLLMFSPDNKTYKTLFTEDQRIALDMITKKGIVPSQYDFIVTTGVIGRSISVYDTSFQDWICNSSEYEDVAQYMRARYNPERQYLLDSARGLVEFTRNNFPIDYYDWHSLGELKQLLIDKPIYTKAQENVTPRKLLTFAAVRKEYPETFEKRLHGSARTVQYRIKPA